MSTQVTAPQPSAASRARAHDRLEFGALKLSALVFFAGSALFGLVFWARGDTFFLRLATEALIYGGLALSVDILLGYAGLLSLGQALYFGIGAYVSALVLKQVAPDFWLALGAGIVAGLLSGIIGGLIAIRVRGVYFALITYGLAPVVAKVIYNTRELGASDGIIGIPVVSIPLGVLTTRADQPVGFFLVVLALIGLVYLALVYLAATPYGRALAGVRVNENRLPFLGYRPDTLKLGAFVLAATIASASGALYPMLRGFVSPELLYFEASTNAVIATIIGGAGTLIGALYGTVLLVYLKSVVGTITEHHQMVIGAVFIVAVIFFPRGLIGFARERMVAWVRARTGGGQ